MARTTIRTDDITDGQVAIADLSATGTASASTFLRGDNSWTAVVNFTCRWWNRKDFLRK